MRDYLIPDHVTGAVRFRVAFYHTTWNREETLKELATEPEQAVAYLVPAVPIKRSVSDECIVCVEDGKKLKIGI